MIPSQGIRLWCPFDDENNPACEDAVQHSWDILAESGMLTDPGKIPKLRRARTGELASRTNPRCSPAALRLAAEWYLWLFAFDDGYCDEGGLGEDPSHMALAVSRLSRCLDASFDLRDPLTHEMFLRRIRAALADQATPPQLRRWESAVREYLAAQVWESANRRLGRIPSLAEYTIMRRHAGATYTCLAIIEVVGGYEVPAALAASVPVQKLNDLAADIVSWDNDVYSFPKEYAVDGAVHNLVGVLVEELQTDAAAAFGHAMGMCDSQMQRFAKTSELVRQQFSSPQLNEYIVGVELWLSGHIAWCENSARFAPDDGTVSGI
ncbi:hypothetical protein ACGFX8_36605 [Streptomyces sp. NPDC048362]|uniref:terpene synthase family protein n=1 Tax=Streptomyces sp. NPDC048362 TaxID=3365539 RepID=UPI0037126DE2